MLSILRKFLPFLLDVTKSFDMFGEPVAELNIDGRSTVRTTLGGGVSLGIWACIISFTFVRG
jgi:hypothetical protein